MKIQTNRNTMPADNKYQQISTHTDKYQQLTTIRKYQQIANK